MKAPSAQARALATLITRPEASVSMSPGLAAAAVAHGVAPILYRTLVGCGGWERVAQPAREVLARVVREAAIVEPLRHAHLERTIAALADAGITPLLFKGAALAHTHYPEPWLRVRGDTDILIRRTERAAVDAVLARLGLMRVARPTGPRVTQQARYTTRHGAIEIAYDVHWRIADPHVFADALSYDVLERASVEGPVPGARRPADVHALLIACVHRAAHHFDIDNVLLVHDIFLLARQLTDAGWQDFHDQAQRWNLRAVCKRALGLTAELFGLTVPEATARALEGHDDEASAAFVTKSMTRLDLLRSDLRALPTWRDRIALLYEHVFPPPAYMRQAAGERSRSAVPMMYVGRLVRGLNAWRHPL